MNTSRPSKMAIIALDCLQKAALEGFERKVLLDQYGIINRNGRACRIPAKEALRMAKSD